MHFFLGEIQGVSHLYLDDRSKKKKNMWGAHGKEINGDQLLPHIQPNGAAPDFFTKLKPANITYVFFVLLNMEYLALIRVLILNYYFLLQPLSIVGYFVD